MCVFFLFVGIKRAKKKKQKEREREKKKKELEGTAFASIVCFDYSLSVCFFFLSFLFSPSILFVQCFETVSRSICLTVLRCCRPFYGLSKKKKEPACLDRPRLKKKKKKKEQTNKQKKKDKLKTNEQKKKKWRKKRKART